MSSQVVFVGFPCQPIGCCLATRNRVARPRNSRSHAGLGDGFARISSAFVRPRVRNALEVDAEGSVADVCSDRAEPSGNAGPFVAAIAHLLNACVVLLNCLEETQVGRRFDALHFPQGRGDALLLFTGLSLHHRPDRLLPPWVAIEFCLGQHHSCPPAISLMPPASGKVFGVEPGQGGQQIVSRSSYVYTLAISLNVSALFFHTSRTFGASGAAMADPNSLVNLVYSPPAGGCHG